MSRRDHTAHDLASLRIDLFGETVKAPFARVSGRKARGTVDSRGNVLAAAPFKKRKRKTIEKEISTQEEFGEHIALDVDDEALESSRPKKKRRIYYPDILPYLDISEGLNDPTCRPENEQPSAVSIQLPL
jgi:hypothetical protein